MQRPVELSFTDREEVDDETGDLPIGNGNGWLISITRLLARYADS